MASHLQALVDELSVQLERTVTVDDEGFHYLAYSPLRGDQHRDLDRLRLESILQREVPPAAKDWAFSLHVERELGPCRIPANPEVGSEMPRIVIPLRRDELVLGFLTLTDPAENPVTDDDLALAVHAGAQASELIYREHIIEDAARSRPGALLADLLSGDIGLRERAARAFHDDEMIAAGRDVVLLALRPVRIVPDDHERQLEALRRAAHRLQRRAATAFGVVRRDHAAFLTASEGTVPVASIARTLLDVAGEQAAGTPMVVGVSAPAARLQAAPEALAQALHAAAVAARIGRFAPIARWEELGVYAMLPTGEAPAWKPPALDPAFLRLVAADRSGALVATLEKYLDMGCHPTAVARALHLHRAGLYYRLRRIEEITGARLDDGEARLALHLSVKLARLTDLEDVGRFSGT